MLSKYERLNIIFERLHLEESVSSREDANLLIKKVVNQVEDEETGLPNDYDSTSGRMFFYSFSIDAWTNLDSDPARLDLNRKHCIELYNNGDILIFEKDKDNNLKEVFNKKGT